MGKKKDFMAQKNHLVQPPTMLMEKSFKELSKNIVQLKQNLETTVLTGSKWCRFHNVPRQIIPSTRRALSSLRTVPFYSSSDPQSPPSCIYQIKISKGIGHQTSFLQTAEPQRHLSSLSKSCLPYTVILSAISSSKIDWNYITGSQKCSSWTLLNGIRD